MQSQKNIKNNLRLLSGLTILSLYLIGCGNSKTANSQDMASRIITTSESQSKSVAYCNQGSSTQMKMNLAAYEENGIIKTNLVRAKLTQVPANFESTAGFIQIWKWKANSNGATYIDPTPVPFNFESIDLGMTITTTSTYVRWAELANQASALQTNTAADFFKRVRMVVDLKDTLGEYDALKVVYYDQSGKVIEQFDMLIPIFSAHPSEYAIEADGSSRASILQALHPFTNQATQNWSASHYQTLANEFCSALNSTAY